MSSEPTEMIPPPPDSPEAIEQQIVQKREELATKIETLSGTTGTTVTEAIQTVATAVGNVTDTLDTVGDTVNRIKQLADPETLVGMVKDTVGSIPLKTTVERHPWATVGAAAAAGFITGLLVFHRPTGGTSLGGSLFAGAFAKLKDRIGSELSKMTDLAIDSAGTALSENVSKLMPLFAAASANGTTHTNGSGV